MEKIKIYKRPSRLDFSNFHNNDLWIIKSKNNNNYFKKFVSKNLKHFVADECEATILNTIQLKNIMSVFKYPDNYNLILLKKRG